MTLKQQLIHNSTKNESDLPQIQVEIKNGMGAIKKVSLKKNIGVRGDSKMGMRSMSTDNSG